MNKICKKRKYNDFCGIFEIKYPPQNFTNRLLNDNKRLKTEIYHLKKIIENLELKFQNLSLTVKKIKENNQHKEEKIPDELKMFYYM
jgi:hypothetical protein